MAIEVEQFSNRKHYVVIDDVMTSRVSSQLLTSRVSSQLLTYVTYGHIIFMT